MKLKVLFLFVILISCNKKESQKLVPQFDRFIFSAAGDNHNYSIKFTQNDTIYIEKRFPFPKQNYYSILKKNQLDSLNKKLMKLDFSKYKSSYINEQLSDGQAYEFLLRKKTSNKKVIIYGLENPKELYELAHWLTSLKKETKLLPTNKNIEFDSLEHKLIQPPPPPIKIDKLIYKK
jgi:hypothetical protein